MQQQRKMRKFCWTFMKVRSDVIQLLLTCLVSADNDEFNDTINEFNETAIKGADGAILVFDITTRPTLDGVRAYYEKLIKIKETDEIPLVVVGTHSDDEPAKAISLMEGDEFAEEYRTLYFEVSNKYRKFQFHSTSNSIRYEC